MFTDVLSRQQAPEPDLEANALANAIQLQHFAAMPVKAAAPYIPELSTACQDKIETYE